MDSNSRARCDRVDFEDGDDSSRSPSPPRPPYELRPSPGKGLGAFATRWIPKHTCVLVEAFQFVIVPPDPTPSTASSSSASSTASNILSQIQAGFDSLTPADQAVYEACHKHRFPGEPDCGRLFYIFRSNAFSIVPADVRGGGSWGTRWGMFPRMARINHSCRPNVANLWVPSGGDDSDSGDTSAARGHHVVWTTRDMAPGEELLIGYVNLLQDTAARQRSLNQFGFQCECPVCCEARDGNPSSDEQRVQIGNMLRCIQDIVIGSEDGGCGGENPGDSCVDDVDTLIRLLKGENGGLAGYLPRVYRLASALGRLAMETEGTGADMIRIQSWEAEEQALVHSILSTDGG